MMEDIDIDTGAAVMVNKTHEGEFHGDQGDLPLPITRSTYKFVMCAAINSCNLGYDIGVGTGAGRLIQEDLGLSRTFFAHYSHSSPAAPLLLLLLLCSHFMFVAFLFSLSLCRRATPNLCRKFKFLGHVWRTRRSILHG